MAIDLARTHLVTLNGGSGCIIQPMTDEYLYVLTAKHNITKAQNRITEFTRFIFEGNQWVVVEIELTTFIENKDYFLHPEKDVAIVKIPFVDGLSEAVRLDNLGEDKSLFSLLGYPEIRRKDQPNKTEWFRRDPNIEILDPRENGMYEAQVPGNATLKEVRGDSGGAILKVENEKIFLAGIQNKMAEEDEQLGRIRLSPITAFDEIISRFHENLAPLLPCYFKSFSFLKDDVFDLNYGILSRERSLRLTMILQAKATELSNGNLVPHEIKKFIQNNLPVLHKQEGYDTYHKKIWILWLELLTILNVAKEQLHAIEDLANIVKKVRIFYSNTNHDFWVEHLRDLHRRDYTGLDENAIVVVASNTKAEDGYHVLKLENIPASITLIKSAKDEFEIERLGMKTNIGTDFPLEKYRFMNISAFKEGTVANIEDTFMEAEIPNCIKTLKELYGQLIPNW